MKKVILVVIVFVFVLMSLSCDDSADHIGEAKTPSGSSIQEGRMLEEVIQDFEDKGFKNIQTEKLDDLITGWLTKDGEVESVSVDGNTGYSPDKWYPEQVEVVIIYHTFPSNDESKEDDELTSDEEEIVTPTYIEERVQKDDFDISTNIELGFEGFDIQIPKYFEDEKIDKGFYQSYAQKGEKITMIHITESYDDADPVSFELLLDDSDNLFRSITYMYDDVEHLNTETYTVSNTKGLLYQYKFSYDNIDSIGYHYCFPIVKSNKWGYVSIVNSFKSNYAYDQEFKKILDSITLTNSSLSRERNPILKSMTDQTENVETAQVDSVITIENNDDFAKLIETYDYATMSKFASTYKGKTIQFDGNIAHMMYHESYKTRYDVLMYGGDYSTTSAVGPSFKFEDVNIVSDLKLTGKNIPEYIEAGQNFKFTAEVLYFDQNSGLFFLKPVKTEAR
jgi:hypothetical protein